jgi:predicted O-methyltransferase YrrM
MGALHRGGRARLTGLTEYRQAILDGRRRLPPSISALWFYSLLRRQERAVRRAWRDQRPLRLMLDSINDGQSIAVRDQQLFDFRLVVSTVHSTQRVDEFAAFLEIVERLRPRRVCELGTYLGGTLWFLARASDPNAVIASVDIDAPLFARTQRARLAGPRQRLVSVEGDSHDAAVRERVSAEMGHQPLDVLFIDGDHTYDGVKQDFEMYSSLVREGGVIAFHDINGGPQGSGPLSGEVPRYWAELRALYPDITQEFVSRTDEEGYGIGVIHPTPRFA